MEHSVVDLDAEDGAFPAAARIIGPDRHPIVPEMLDRDALLILKKLASAGHAGYLVGGGVRDLYLGKTPKDFDISTDARPGQLRKLFPNSNTIGRRFRLVQVFFRGGKTIEVSTLRSLCEHDLDGPEEVLPPNNTFGTVSEDARRRDLTINSLFYEIETGTIIDYVGGVEDLDRGIVRIAGDPARRVSRDPVRMMRAIRHAARNGFTIEEETWKAICANSDKLALCPPSRLRDEFLKDLYCGHALPWFRLAERSGLFPVLFPIYRKAFANEGERPAIVQQLASLFSVIDEANRLATIGQGHRQPDYFFFALLFIPWVERRWQLYSQFRKGAALYQLARQIRDELDGGIGVDLNLRRSLRQETVTLLVNLALFIHSKSQGGWPKWLKRKSYFKKSKLFYDVYLAATEGAPLGDELVQADLFPVADMVPVAPVPATTTTPAHPPPPAKPAFSSRRGGVFGFKK